MVGAGDVAARAMRFLPAGVRVVALVRRPETAPVWRERGAKVLIADLDDRRSLRRLAGLASWVWMLAPPPAAGTEDPRSRRLAAALARGGRRPRRLVYVGTSGIYGDRGGAWVRESDPPRPQTARGKRRLAAERCWRAFARRRGVRLTILRAPGIYAEDRLPLERLRRGWPVPREPVWTNHIHADDLARALWFATFRGASLRAYHVVDESELTLAAFYERLAATFGLPPPPRLPLAEALAAVPPVVASFMRESRRLRFERLRRELRLRLRHPTVEGVLAAIAARRETKG
ncbi:NAD-dependent epimerase/dehydratase family protein [Tepidiphilus baoligensis]|uniref:NAD-dependent epimerase/dehydratase family protein n=1 Tax=Tepidiphilus baoligensis TaxID=2698687 RepID=UPI0019D62DE5|nr:NAD-dependent epimerase/dehydratase family protein [Tepidiphilus baoligensis]